MIDRLCRDRDCDGSGQFVERDSEAKEWILDLTDWCIG